MLAGKHSTSAAAIGAGELLQRTDLAWHAHEASNVAQDRNKTR
jgi:hypothetical protein